jgi:hypothetical protein
MAKRYLWKSCVWSAGGARCVMCLMVVVWVAGLLPARPPENDDSAMSRLNGVETTDTALPKAPLGSNRRICPKEPTPRVVEIRTADPQVDKQYHDRQRGRLVEAVSIPNTTVLLGPNVVLDFSDAKSKELPLLTFGPCVTLTSARSFAPDTIARTLAQQANSDASASQIIPGIDPFVFGPPARAPRSLGPLIKYNPQPPQHESDWRILFWIGCEVGPDPRKGENVRISGFRLHGPSFGQQRVENIGIKIYRCLNVEISNMEIAGWGRAAIQVDDDASQDQGRGTGQEQPDNRPGDRIGRPSQIRIFNNYIHHNQRPSINGHATGYGVEVHNGAWAQIYENVFDFNRHAIAASGNSGGYEALRNLVLKGGGFHREVIGFDYNTHQFDIHGAGDNGSGGWAGVEFLFANNAFQYLAGPAIEVRGRPFRKVDIRDNVFAHEGLENDWGDDAIHVRDRANLDRISLGPNNVIDFDSFGRSGVCDFDGDAIDDLFLATGQTWWFSSSGEFQWTYLSARIERLNQVRLGYFDNDNRCDVLTESGGQWVIASGGVGPWKSIGWFGTPLAEVSFGRFDPNVRDYRPGVTRRTTHSFRRLPSGQWQLTPLTLPAWRSTQSSSLPISMLRFGDFTGDGVTDVLSVQRGRWAISESATGIWQQLNPHLGDDVRPLFIADLNNNNVDDLIKLEETSGVGGVSFTWYVSDDGRSPWRKLTSLKVILPVSPAHAYAGRFGLTPGGGVLLIDGTRFGHFYSPAEIAVGASPTYTSLFPY